MVSDSCKKFQSIFFPHQLENFNSIEQKVIIMEIAERNFLIEIFFIDALLQKLLQINRRNNGKVLELIDQRVGMSHVYAIIEPFLLALILVKDLTNIDAIIPIFRNSVVLKFGSVAQPLIDFIKIRIVIGLPFVDLVEIRLAGGDVHALIDVVGLQLQILHGITLQIFQLLQILIER